MSVAGKTSLAIAGVVMGLLLAELGVRVSEKFGGADVAVREPDALLGFRVKGNAPGHDANGFRNDAVPERADVIAIGDSQTWGYNADRHEAWPQKLAALSGRSVYNMGVGGYGPPQYHALTKKALGMSPKVLVVGLYFGNDFYDSYATVYGNDAYAHLRDGGAAPHDLSPNTIEPRIKALDEEKKAFDGRFAPRGPSLWLREHTALGRLLHGAGLLPGDEQRWFEVNKAWADSHPSHGAAYDDGRTRTIFNTAYRLLALDMDDPRIAEGLRLSCKFLSLIKAEAEAAGVRLLVVFIPTKEAVYADASQSGGAKLNENYGRLVEMETRARAKTISFCEGAGIEYVDAGPALREAVKAGRQLYLTNLDGHPNAQAYHLIAATVNESLSGPGR